MESVATASGPRLCGASLDMRVCRFEFVELYLEFRTRFLPGQFERSFSVS